MSVRELNAELFIIEEKIRERKYCKKCGQEMSVGHMGQYCDTCKIEMDGTMI